MITTIEYIQKNKNEIKYSQRTFGRWEISGIGEKYLKITDINKGTNEFISWDEFANNTDEFGVSAEIKAYYQRYVDEINNKEINAAVEYIQKDEARIVCLRKAIAGDKSFKEDEIFDELMDEGLCNYAGASRVAKLAIARLNENDEDEKEDEATHVIPKWDGKKPQIEKVKFESSGIVQDDVSETIRADILINGFVWTQKAKNNNEKEILRKLREDFINGILIKPETLPAVFKFFESKEGIKFIDIRTGDDIRDIVDEGKEVYSKNSFQNMEVFKFIKNNWTDELYGFLQTCENLHNVSESKNSEIKETPQKINKTEIINTLSETFGQDVTIITEKPSRANDHQINVEGIDFEIYDTDSCILFAYPSNPEAFQHEDEFKLNTRCIETLEYVQEHGNQDGFHQYELQMLDENGFMEFKFNEFKYKLTQKGLEALNNASNPNNDNLKDKGDNMAKNDIYTKNVRYNKRNGKVEVGNTIYGTTSTIDYDCITGDFESCDSSVTCRVKEINNDFTDYEQNRSRTGGQYGYYEWEVIEVLN